MTPLREHQQALNRFYSDLLREVTKPLPFWMQLKRRSRWQRFKDRCAVPLQRMRDAWLVLVGKAEISDGDY